MNVWYHLPTIFNWRRALQIAGLITLCVALITTLFLSSTTRAAPGVNQALSFQGRLLNSSGGAVADGYYNIQFKIYQDGAGTTAGNSGGTLEWTENYINNGGTSGVQVKNGYFSVTLGSVNPFGSQVDWNQDTLWLSMNVAGTSASCTTFGSSPCTADGEMLPMKRMTAVPQALNSQMLGGKTADGFIQNGTTAQTADFNISGTGKANIIQGNTSVIAPLFDRADAGTLDIGSAQATTINIGSAATNQTINIGSGEAVIGLTLGSDTGASSTLIQGGNQGVRVASGGGFVVQSTSSGTYNLEVSQGGSTIVRLGSSENFTVHNSLGANLFSVSENLNLVNVSYGTQFKAEGDATFERGITVQGTGALTYTTPGGANLSTAINIPNYTVAAYNSVMAFGLPGTSAATARGLLVADGRTGTHQSTIGVLSPDENQILGLSWKSDAGTGANQIGTLTNTANSLALQGNGLNLLTATNNAGSANVGIGNDASAGYALDVTGTIRATTALYTPAVDTAVAGTLTIGGTNATSINLAQDVTVAAGKSLTITGGNTASRPASPTEGMLYFDTTTKQLLVYANGKWQADRSTASKIVATSATGGTSSAVASNNADSADYVNTSTTSAQTTINSALSAIGTNGGSVYLAEGTYIIDGSISIPNNVTLIGAGSGTIIKLKNGINADINAIIATDTTTGTGVKVSNLRIDGNKANQTTGTQNGIYFNNMGGGNGTSARPGTKLNDLWISNLRSYGIMLENSNNATISGNHLNNNLMGLYLKNAFYVTVTGNLSQGNVRGLYASPIYQTTITGNTFETNSNYGALIDGTSSGNTFTGNNITNNAIYGLGLSTATDNIVSGNRFRNSGGGSTNEAIVLFTTSTGNTITGNTITDTSATTNNYAIDVQDSASTGNQFSNNSLGGGSINDAGTANMYANQLDANGKLINKTTSGTKVQTTTNDMAAFQVQNAAGTSALTVDTTTNSVLVAGAVDTTTAAGMTIGSANATSITIGKSASNITTTFLGTAIFKPTTSNDSTTAFQLQRADGTKMLVADSTNQTITFGNSASGNYTVISTSTGAITKYGNARNTRKISLAAEYTNSVLDAGTGSNNTGTMTSSIDLTNRMNYYKWTTSQGSNQSYDVVVQVPIPTDFDGWASSNPLSISTYTSNTTNGTITLEARDSSNAVQCNFVSITPGSTGTWTTNNSACTLSSGTYTAGDYMTLRIRMQSPNGGDVRVGNISLNYLSKY